MSAERSGARRRVHDALLIVSGVAIALLLAVGTPARAASPAAAATAQAAAPSASPSASTDTSGGAQPEAGDTRSSGEGAGFVGQPVVAIAAVVLVGLVAAGATLAYVRLTAPGRR